MNKFPYEVLSGDIVIAKFVNESDAELCADALQEAFDDAEISVNLNP